ncbi:MAG: hypothetical protein PHW04_17840, partial [Candidatus Wallbacteria bacterium]|nr:hypothetical protein [Candidatus Wallbacteria bacterium]
LHEPQGDPPKKWDTNDEIELSKDQLVDGKYQVLDTTEWNHWIAQPIPVDCTLNFKSKPDFGAGSQFIVRDFRSGATRRMEKLSHDSTVYDGKMFRPEGIVECTMPEDLSFTVANPGCLLTERGLKIDRSSYQDCRSFVPPTALGIVTRDGITVGNGTVRAGICSKSGIRMSTRLVGNLVVEEIHKEDISGRLIFDHILRRLSEEGYGNDTAKQACFVMTISPIPQEFFDWNNLK